MKKNLKDYIETQCSCKTCIDMCKRPCWPTPEEALLLIEKGYAKRLMLDWWVEDSGIDTYIVCPASEGSGGRFAPNWPSGSCVFLTLDNQCELHNLGLKPIEGRLANCVIDTPSLHERVAELWRTSDLTERVINLWKKK